MPDFLESMARGSRRRLAEARAREPEAAMRRRALETAAPAALPASRGRFALLAEIKPRSPSAGPLGSGDPASRARAYARGGAAALSVLTEPERFGGTLADLGLAAASGLPAMRKDFLVDPYQVFEARAAGGAGVLLIVRLLADGDLSAMLEAAAEAGLFAIVEAFDSADLERVRAIPTSRRPPAGLLVGVNARDLGTLEVDRSRLGALAPALPADLPRVAESGLASPEDVSRAVAAGYDAALVGEALMRAADPAGAVRALVEAGRAACASS